MGVLKPLNLALVARYAPATPPDEKHTSRMVANPKIGPSTAERIMKGDSSHARTETLSPTMS